MPKKKRETQLKRKQNRWEARLNRHNRLTGILDDEGVFGTASFTRLQLWKMLGAGERLKRMEPPSPSGGSQADRTRNPLSTQ
jgi:hypothetical protein